MSAITARLSPLLAAGMLLACTNSQGALVYNSAPPPPLAPEADPEDAGGAPVAPGMPDQDIAEPSLQHPIGTQLVIENVDMNALLDPLWMHDELPVMRLYFESPDWEDTLFAAAGDPDDYEDCGSKQYATATAIFESTMGGIVETYEDVGVRLRGHSSLWKSDLCAGEKCRVAAGKKRAGLKLSFNTFRKGRRFHDVRKINLQGTEGSYCAVREHLSLMLMREFGIPAPRTGFMWLYVNDELRGIFPHTEEIDDEPYLDHHFKEDPGGSLYKTTGYCGGPATFEYKGNDPIYYDKTHEPKVDTEPADMLGNLIPMIQCVNVASDAEFEECIPEWIDVPQFLREIAADATLPDIDAVHAAGQNFMLYYKPAAGRFVIYPWDKDLSLTDGFLTDGAAGSLFGQHPYWKADFSSRLADRLLDVFRPQFCHTVQQFMELYDSDEFVPRIHALKTYLGPHVKRDPFIEWGPWVTCFDATIDLVEQRGPNVAYEAKKCLEDFPEFEPPNHEPEAEPEQPETDESTEPVEGPALMINEFMPKNRNAYASESGMYPDWIELYNPTSAPIVLDGWSITDNPQKPTKHVFDGALTIHAGGHLLLLADNEPGLGTHHLAFKLAKGGGSVALYDPEGRGAVVNYGKMASDMSVARFPDGCTGDDCLKLIFVGTPGAANGVARPTLYTTDLVEPNSKWRYRDNGVDPGPEWHSPSFNATSWLIGFGPFGYGDVHIKTQVSSGGDADDKHMTTWFRQPFAVKAVDKISHLNLRLMRDDGAVVYINGVEIMRSNMPDGPIGPDTEAISGINEQDETRYITWRVDPAVLVEGMNIVAVEVHQNDPASSDLTFDLSLDARTLAP